MLSTAMWHNVVLMHGIAGLLLRIIIVVPQAQRSWLKPQAELSILIGV